MRTYTVEPRGKAFVTVCRVDGDWAGQWLSKSKKLARRKGDEFLSGERSTVRTYTTEYGRKLNEIKSLPPRRIALLHGRRGCVGYRDSANGD